jgi:hypothetical protein
MPDQTPDAGALLAGNAQPQDPPVAQQPNPVPAGAPIQAAPLPPQNTATPLGSPAASPQAAQPNPTAVAQVAKHAMFGKAVKNLLGALEGVRYNYNVDPQSGQMVETPVKQRPGAFFRQVLAGALLSGAAATEAHAQNPYLGGLGGFAVGAGSAIKNQQQQDQMKRQQAQQAFERQRETEGDQMAQDKEQQEQSLFQVHLAHWTVQELNSAAMLNLDNEKEINQQNEQGQVLLDHVMEEHGKLATDIPDNGTVGNAPKLMKYFADHSSAMIPGDGSMRVVVKSVDINGLAYDPQHFGWKDAKTGEHVDLDDRTTWKVYDIPNNALGVDDKVPVSGRELKKLFPSGTGDKLDPNATYRITPSEMVAAGTHERERANTATREDFANQNERLNTTLRIIQEKVADARSRLSSLPDKESDEANGIREEIKGLDGQLDQLFADVNPHVKAYNPTWQQIHFPWNSLKANETAMVDPMGHMKAVPTGQLKVAQAKGWKVIPKPSEAQQ